MKAGGRACELCGGEAAVHCGADAAYLCWACDERVHGANFLVARHVRRVVACCACDGPTGHRLSGPGSSAPIRTLCPSCRSDAGDPATSPSSSSSSCISSAESSAAREGKPPSSSSAARSRRCVSAEAVLEEWGRRLGLRGGRRCVEAARHVMGACGREMAVVPLRVALAAALWHGVKACREESNRARRRGGRTCEATLRRLEACSGVPARLIVLAESRIARAARRTRLYEEEGWAECAE